jgi:hypothetical protein
MDLIILCIELCVLNYGTMYLSNYVLNIAIELCVELWTYIYLYGIVCSITNHSILPANVIIVI